MEIKLWPLGWGFSLFSEKKCDLDLFYFYYKISSIVVVLIGSR